MDTVRDYKERKIEYNIPEIITSGDIEDLDRLSLEDKKKLTNQLHNLTNQNVTFDDVKKYRDIIANEQDNKKYAQLAINNNSLPLFKYFYDKYGFYYPLNFSEAFPQFNEENKSYESIDKKFRWTQALSIPAYKIFKAQLPKQIYESFANAWIANYYYLSLVTDIEFKLMMKSGIIPKSFMFMIHSDKGKLPSINIIKYFMENGYSINNKAHSGNLLNYLVFFIDSYLKNKDYLPLVKFLTENGIDVNLRDEEYLTPLYRIMENTNDISIPIFEMLLKAGAEYDKWDENYLYYQLSQNEDDFTSYMNASMQIDEILSKSFEMKDEESGRMYNFFNDTMEITKEGYNKYRIALEKLAIIDELDKKKKLIKKELVKQKAIIPELADEILDYMKY